MLNTFSRRNIKIALLLVTSVMLIGIGRFVVELWLSNSQWKPTSVAIIPGGAPTVPEKMPNFSLPPQFSHWKVSSRPEGFSFRYPPSMYIDDSWSYQGDAQFPIRISVCSSTTCAKGPEYAQVEVFTDYRLFSNGVGGVEDLISDPVDQISHEVLKNGLIIDGFSFRNYRSRWFVATWKKKRVIVEYSTIYTENENIKNESLARSIARTIEFR